LKELNGTNSSNTMRSLALGTICTDLGKAGDLLPTEDGYNPDNFIARLYRMRWIKEHAEYCGKSRTEIPLEEALIVMAAVAKKNHPKTPPDEIDKSFTLSDQDRALLASKNYQLSLSTPLSRAFTELHVKADDVLLKKLEIDLPERAYACGHHLPAGLNLIPAEIVEMYHLNGDQGADELFISYIANTAVIVVADKLQGYIHRSGQLPQDGLISTVKDITEGLESNFANHPLKKKIIEIYTKVFEFAIVNHLAEYYGQ
jgi:hypothetical protein